MINVNFLNSVTVKVRTVSRCSTETKEEDEELS